MSILKTVKVSILLILMTLLPPTLQAQEKPGYTISPMVGVTEFDSDIGEDLHWSLGFGYQFKNPWAVEFVYSDVNADDDRTGLDLDFTRWHLDGLYHLNQIGAYRPYLSFGAGRGEYEFSPGTTDTDTLLNVGIGVKYEFANNTSFRSEIKLFEGNDIDDAEYAFSVGLHHVFAASSPRKAAVKIPQDSDGDGVLDGADQCPTTQAGEAVDDFGCELDSDRDGILDKNDRCPDTRDRMAKIDQNGCYILLTETVTIKLDVEFDNDSSESRAGHRQEVAKVSKFMQSYPLTKVTIEGHTDANGKAAYNQSLSERRAATIANMLVDDLGIDRSRVSAIGYGEDRPINDNTTEAGRQMNRRVVGRIEASYEKMQMKN